MSQKQVFQPESTLIFFLFYYLGHIEVTIPAQDEQNPPLFSSFFRKLPLPVLPLL
jgi:hypothetical protein